MGKIIIINIIRFILLFVLQIMIFSKINFMGYINPYPYLLFILLFPVWGSKNLLLVLSFLLGFSIDLFSNSGGVHAMASLFIALLYWLGLRWEQDMDTPRGNKWLLLISLVIGLTFGVHFMAQPFSKAIAARL